MYNDSLKQGVFTKITHLFPKHARGNDVTSALYRPSCVLTQLGVIMWKCKWSQRGAGGKLKEFIKKKAHLAECVHCIHLKYC